jgi:hypothetical protein
VRGNGRDRAVGRDPASTGTGAGGQPAAGTAAGGGGAGECSGTESKEFGCVPAGCTLTAQTPSPVIRSSPVQAALQLTNLPTWLWIPAGRPPESRTVTVPGVSHHASANSVCARGVPDLVIAAAGC